jgi:hypothetical protein
MFYDNEQGSLLAALMKDLENYTMWNPEGLCSKYFLFALGFNEARRQF